MVASISYIEVQCVFFWTTLYITTSANEMYMLYVKSYSGIFRRGLMGVKPLHDMTHENFFTMLFSLHYVLFPVTNSGNTSLQSCTMLLVLFRIINMHSMNSHREFNNSSFTNCTMLLVLFRIINMHSMNSHREFNHSSFTNNWIKLLKFYQNQSF